MNIKHSHFFLGFFLMAGSSFVSASKTATQLEFESMHLKFAANQGDDMIVGIFKFTNTSDDLVEINDVKTSCGCTVPDLAKNVYAPGESGELKAVFTIGGRVGHQAKKITVVTKSGNYDLMLETNIHEPIKIRPRYLLWSQNADPKEVAIEVDSEDVYEVRSIDIDNGFSYTSEVVEEGKRYKLSIVPPEGVVLVRGLLMIQMKNVTHDRLLPPTRVQLQLRLPEKSGEKQVPVK